MAGPNLAMRIVEWLRAGYPRGVPRRDHVALLGILRRELTDDEIVDIVAGLWPGAVEAQVRTQQIRESIEAITWQTATDADLERVTGRLIAAGWVPDSDEPDTEADTTDADRGVSLVARFASWVRQGYPAGVPASDYNALIALLRRRLTSEEIIDIVVALRGQQVIATDTGSIGAAIMGTTNEVPSPEDIERVRRQLIATGDDFLADDPQREGS